MTKRPTPKIGRSDERGMPDVTTPAMKAARDALKKRKGAPDAADALPFGTFPGASVKPIPGQLRLGDAPSVPG